MATPKTVESRIKTVSKAWKGWKKVRSWAKKSKKTADEWEALVQKRIDSTLKKLKKRVPETYEGLTEEIIEEIFEAAKRLTHQNQYVKETKTGSRAKVNEYFVWILHQVRYFDWGGRKYSEAMTKYANSSKANKEIMMQEGWYKVDRDSSSSKTGILPMMNWGSKRRRPIPEQAYMGKAFGVAVPVIDYMNWVNEITPDIENIMPCEIDLRSNVDKNVHYGDTASADYIWFEPFGRYKMNLMEQRGNRIVLEDNTKYYLYQGLTEVIELEEPETGEKVKKTLYDGQRSFMYNLAPAQSHELIEASEEFDFEDIDKYMLNIAYETWASPLVMPIELERKNFKSDKKYENALEEAESLRKEMSGMAQIETFFEYNSFNFNKKKDRVDAIHPIAFTADINSTYESEDDATSDRPKFYSCNIDDQLDSKMPEESDFTEMRLSLPANMIDFEDKFGKLAAKTRIKCICSLAVISQDDPITAECIWFEITKSTSLDPKIFSDDLFAMDEDEEDENIEEDDEEEKSEEEDDEDEADYE